MTGSYILSSSGIYKCHTDFITYTMRGCRQQFSLRILFTLLCGFGRNLCFRIPIGQRLRRFPDGLYDAHSATWRSRNAL